MAWTVKRLKEDLTEILACDPEVDRIENFVAAFDESCAIRNVAKPTEENVRKALEELVAEGVAQRAGRNGYEATEAFMLERDCA